MNPMQEHLQNRRTLKRIDTLKYVFIGVAVFLLSYHLGIVLVHGHDIDPRLAPNEEFTGCVLYKCDESLQALAVGGNKLTDYCEAFPNKCK